MLITIDNVYLENTAGNIDKFKLLALLEKIPYVTDYFFILHDRDYKDDVTLKQAHYHIIINASIKEHRNIIEKLKETKEVQELISKCPNIKFTKVVNARAMIRYLTHKDNPEKTKYKDNEVITNNQVAYDSLIQGAKTNDDVLKDLIEFLQQEKKKVERDDIIYIKEETIFIYFKNINRLDYYMKNQDRIRKLLNLAGLPVVEKVFFERY